HDLSALIRPRLYRPRVNSPESVSDVKSFGQIHFNMKRRTATEWVEIISHETGHHYLLVMFAAFHRQLAIDWDTPVPSAIRGEERPLLGLMHAVMAESFMVFAAHRILVSPSLANHHADAQALMQRMGNTLMVDFATAEPFQLFSMEAAL